MNDLVAFLSDLEDEYYIEFKYMPDWYGYGFVFHKHENRHHPPFAFMVWAESESAFITFHDELIDRAIDLGFNVNPPIEYENTIFQPILVQ